MIDDEKIIAYRDDGRLAEGLRRGGAALPVPTTIAMLLGPVLLVAGLVLDRGVVGGSTGAGLALYVVLTSIGAGKTGAAAGRLHWLGPALLRVGEYGFALALAWFTTTDGLPVIYSLLAMVAFHHYDIVYRIRHQRLAPPKRIQWLGLGWEGRMIVMYALAVAGLLPLGAAILAIYCGVLFVSESAASWVVLATDTARSLSMATDDEDED